MRLQYQEMTRRWSEMHVGYLCARVAFGTELNYTELSVYFWWSLCTLKLYGIECVLLVEFMYLIFTRMPGESYRRRLRSLLLCLCDVFQSSAD